jgi:7,8-dihydropterin-6-yl-methyl-4-(beta-D-ribofuranosyl)aminobenzene 5'-phosphate synthase
MQKLGIDPKEIELVVLSHMHWDHIGGVYHFLNKNQQVTLYLPTSFSAHFRDDVRRYGASIVEARKVVRICEQVYSSGDLGSGIYEQSLFLQTGRGVIIITGCAHPGIVNIVQKAKELLKNEILLAMGGFHLRSESQTAIEHIVSDFRTLGVGYVGPCHCSGDLARQAFDQEYRHNFISVGIGRVIHVKDLIKR